MKGTWNCVHCIQMSFPEHQYWSYSPSLVFHITLDISNTKKTQNECCTDSTYRCHFSPSLIRVPNLNSQKCTWKYKGYSLGAFISICPADITKKCRNSGVVLLQTEETSSFRYQIFSGIVLFCSHLPETQNFYEGSGGKKKRKKRIKKF